MIRGYRAGMREKTRPARSVPRLFREKVRPARHKTPNLCHFDHAGRTFSRTGSCDVATLKPLTPLQPLMQTNVKPPSPMLAPEQRPLKPPSPLQPKYAPKTPISHPQRRRRFQTHAHTSEQRRHRFQTHARTSEQRRWRFQLRLSLPEERRWRFQLRLSLREQRRHRFHAKDFQCPQAMARPNQHTFACNSTTDTSRVSMQSLKFQAFHRAAECRRQGIACEIAKR